MPHRDTIGWWTAALWCISTGCSSPTAVTSIELSAVVERDAVPFAGTQFPGHLVDLLAGHRVVVLGETHHLREHYQLTTDLLIALHTRGFRQLLVEQPQMADWWLNDYATAGPLAPPWEPPAHWRTKYAALREFNAGLPLQERIQVRAIDANEAYYGGAASFRGLLEGLIGTYPSTGPVTAFLQAGYGSASAQRLAIAALATALRGDQAALAASWGEARYAAIVEMVEAERASVEVRVQRTKDDDRAARSREDLIKQLTDARLATSPYRTVINIGGNHAQKSHLKGTKQEWLGDYLVHRSPEAAGDVFVISLVSARTVLEPGASGTDFDVVRSSPPDELFRVLAETFSGQHTFLQLLDPVFTTGRTRVNYEETIYLCSLAKHYDAVVQFGLAHRVPIE